MAALLVILTVSLNLLGPPIGIFFAARWEAKKMPRINVSAQPLTDYSVSAAPGKALSYLNYSFEVPWNASFKTEDVPEGVRRHGGIKV